MSHRPGCRTGITNSRRFLTIHRCFAARQEDLTIQRVAVIGAGISGLSAAFELTRAVVPVEVRVFESASEPGGILRTIVQNGYLVEKSADMFTVREPWARELCEQIGFTDQLIPPNPDHRKAFIIQGGRLVDIPAGFTLMAPTQTWPILTSSLLTWKGKMRLACEYFVRPKPDQTDESLAEFATRRMGKNAYENLIQPLIGGIYTADPNCLSMQAALPQLVRMEQEHGSLTKAMRKAQSRQKRQDSGARYGMFMTPKQGFSSLIAELITQLPSGTVRYDAPISRVSLGSTGKWQLRLGRSEELESFDALVVATPSPVSASILESASQELAAELRRITHASATILALGFRRADIGHRLNGFGAVAPLKEHSPLLSISFSSIKFPGRAPDGEVLLRAFLGGACQPELAELSDEESLEVTLQELRRLLGLKGEPTLVNIVRWKKTMPQYHLGHIQLVDRIEALANQLPRFALAGNAYRGVGIPFCVRSGREAAQRVL